MEKGEIQVRLARKGEAARVADLIRQVFSSELLMASIYSSPRVWRYVREQIRMHPISETVYVVALARGAIIACAEWRRIGSTLFLNYIAVLPEFQGGGLGTRILSFSLDQLAGDVSSVQLDVAESNVAAKGWYRRLGFRRESSTVWWKMPLPRLGPASNTPTVIGFPQAEASHRLYGFSRFVVKGSSEYTIGRLGEAWFRVDTPQVLTDPSAVSVLARLDQGRGVLVPFHDGALAPDEDEHTRVLVALERMTVEVGSLKAALGPSA